MRIAVPGWYTRTNCPGAKPPIDWPSRCGAGRSLVDFVVSSRLGIPMPSANLNTGGGGGGRAASGGGGGAFDDGVFFPFAQAAIVQELAVRRIRVPRRHQAERDFFTNGLRPGARVLEGEKRHRRDFAGPVAVGAILIKDRRDVPTERR